MPRTLIILALSLAVAIPGRLAAWLLASTAPAGAEFRLKVSQLRRRNRLPTPPDAEIREDRSRARSGDDGVDRRSPGVGLDRSTGRALASLARIARTVSVDSRPPPRLRC